VTTKNEEKCRFCTPKSPKTPQNGPTNRKHAIFGAQTPIFWTQTSRPSKMKELNKALHRTAHKAPPVTADVRHKKMKLPKNFWTYTKASLLSISFIVGFATGPSPIHEGDSPPPFWLAIIPVVFFSIFLPPFLRAFKPTEQYITVSPWPAFPFSLFRDPYPFWHLGVWACFTGAVPQTFHALTPHNHDQMVMALFMWSCGVGTLLGITRTKRILKRKIGTVEPAPSPYSSPAAGSESGEA